MSQGYAKDTSPSPQLTHQPPKTGTLKSDVADPSAACLQTPPIAAVSTSTPHCDSLPLETIAAQCSHEFLASQEERGPVTTVAQLPQFIEMLDTRQEPESAGMFVL